LKYPTQDLSLAREFNSNKKKKKDLDDTDLDEQEATEQPTDTAPVGSDHNKRTRCKQVSFGDLTTSLHEIILGDNPAVSSGLPITIDWKPFEEVKETIEEHEQQKVGTEALGWRSEAVVLPPMVRESMIPETTPRDERNEITRVVGEIQRSRLVTAKEALKGKPLNDNEWQWKTLFIRNNNNKNDSKKTKKKSHLNWIRE
jgi:hypothetical protein